MTLTVPEKTELEVHEDGIRDKADGIGLHFRAIKAKKLYRDYGTFEEYCKDKWGFTPRHVNRLIEFEDIKDNLKSGHKCPVLPQVQQHAEPLSRVPPNKQAEAWEEAVRTAPNGKVTTEHVEEVVKSKYTLRTNEDYDGPEDCDEETGEIDEGAFKTNRAPGMVTKDEEEALVKVRNAVAAIRKTARVAGISTQMYRQIVASLKEGIAAAKEGCIND